MSTLQETEYPLRISQKAHLRVAQRQMSGEQINASDRDKTALIEDSITRSIVALQSGKNVLLNIYDRTTAAGAHITQVLIDPLKGRVLLEMPDAKKGGEVPTMLHAIEVITRIIHEGQNLGLKWQFPSIEYVRRDAINTLKTIIPDQELFETILPFTVDPAENVYIWFDRNKRHISAQEMAKAYYNELQIRSDVLQRLPFHLLIVAHGSERMRGEMDIDFGDQDREREFRRPVDHGRFKTGVIYEQTISRTPLYQVLAPSEESEERVA